MNHQLSRLFQGTALTVLTLASAQAAETDLANVPLANATTATLLPNIMFILDNSGSMKRNYMPDYIQENAYCRDASDGGTALDTCRLGDPPYMVTAFNGVAYNPAVTYSPPVNADGSVKAGHNGWLASSHDWAHVPNDGYGVIDTGTTNLTSGFPERTWCDGAGGTGTCKSALDASNNYIYPNPSDPVPRYQYVKTVYGAPYSYTATVEWCPTRNTSGTYLNFGTGTCQSTRTADYPYVKYSNWQRVDIKPATTSYTKASTRTDCAGATCTYNEEMANFANWYAWYGTRMQMMKTSVSLAFKDVRGTPDDADPTDKNYFHARIGYTTISYSGTTDGTSYLAISEFNGTSASTQKGKFYDRLFNADGDSYTPLRGALAKAGKIYAGVKGADPIQQSCQRNFTILSTDGYWNSNTESASYGPDKIDGSDIGDIDGAATCNPEKVLPLCTTAGTCNATPTLPECDKQRKSPTLADVAYYYYHTDLRPSMEDNVPAAGININEDDVASHQHMTTFTIGLGVDGTLRYVDGYKSLNSGAYYDIKQGSKDWPNPMLTEDETRIDDLWHAAVNGRGTYFSAKDPTKLVAGLRNALGSIKSTAGAGAAAATSNLQPTAGDNYIYIANYRTVKWDGELSAYTIDLSSGAISSGTSWLAAALLDAKINSTGDGDTRSIYTSLTGSSGLVDFTWASLTATERAYFDNSKLSQYAGWSDTNKTAATGTTMLNYLRGHNRNEDQDRAADYGTYYRLYRDREKVLGDIVHSQPIYVGKPLYDYSDSGYSAFKSANAGRAATVYVAANDGMLHAFDAGTGQERWAYVPALVMKEMWRLADKDFSTNHRFFVDGPTAVSDIQSGGWKTILVGTLGKGGRGIYALDVTNPSSPQPLWTFGATENQNMGYTYGMPMITKLADGTWVVVVGSGYNNVPEGANYPDADGQGRVFVLNAATGALIRTINTGVGSVTAPAGLAHLNVKVADFQTDNTALAAYGGDLLGNVWRFNLDDGSKSKVIALGTSQPVSSAPELGEIDGKTVLFFGTGRYLGSTDLDDAQTQAIYGIRDDGSTQVTLSSLVAQSISGSGTSRSVTSASVDWSVGYGWYVNLPDAGERVHLPAQLYFGTLLISSLVPQATECQPGGYSWLYFLDYKTGGRVETNTVAIRYPSPLVGLTVAKLPGGTPKVYGITADGGVPPPPSDLPIATAGSGGATSGKRVMWRELLD